MAEPPPPSPRDHASFEGLTAVNTGAQLIHAAENGDLELVNFLLRHRADANFTDEEGCTPLHWAAENGHVDVVKWLLVVSNINVDARTPRDGMTPLLAAVKRGNYPIVQLLLESRPQLEAMAIVDDLCGKIMFASEGVTALYMAVTSGSVELAELLLNFGANPNEPLIVRTTDPDAGTVETSLHALHAAVRMEDFAMASLLLAYQANVDASIQFTADEGINVIDGGTALYGAVNDGHLKMAELLLSAGASASISGRIPGPDGSVVDGWTALHAAVSHGNAEMVKLLVERGAVVDATTSTCSPDGTSISEGMTAMCAAAQRGLTDIVKILIKGGADVNAPVRFRSPEGIYTEATALLAAVGVGETAVEVISVLLDHDADVPEGTAIAVVDHQSADRMSTDRSVDGAADGVADGAADGAAGGSVNEVRTPQAKGDSGDLIQAQAATDPADSPAAATCGFGESGDLFVNCFSANTDGARARVLEANAELAQGAQRTLERAHARQVRHSYVLEQRQQARERADKERKERERRELQAKQTALLREERRAKAAMEALMVSARKDATEEMKAIKNMAAGTAKVARIRKLRAKYHPDKNLPGLRNEFTQLSAFVNMETDKLKS